MWNAATPSDVFSSSEDSRNRPMPATAVPAIGNAL